MKMIMQWRPVRWICQIAEFLRPMQIRVHGAYTSFFLVVAVFPMLVLLFAVLGYTSFGLEEVMALVSQVLPEAIVPMVERVIAGAYENTSGTVLSVSLVAALWSASRSILGLVEGLNAVYGIREDRTYLHIRGIGLVYTFLFLLVLVLTLVFHVFGTTILDYLRMTTDPLLLFLMDVFDLRYGLTLTIQIVLFTTIYAYLPNKRHKLIQSLPGAVLASVGWTGFSKLFSLYVDHFPSYSNVFGSVYAVALAMMWLYFCVCIVFYGAALDRYLMERWAREG